MSGTMGRAAIGIFALGTLLHPAAADERGPAILREAYRTLYAARTFTANVTCTTTTPGEPAIVMTGTIAALKPNYLRVELSGDVPVRQKLLFASNGKSYRILADGMDAEKEAPAEAAPTGFSGEWEGEVDAFFGGEKSLPTGKIEYLGSDKVDDVECDRVRAVIPQGTVVYSIGKTDHLIRRATISVAKPNGGDAPFMQTNTLSRIRFNRDLGPHYFQFPGPAGDRLAE